MTRFLIAAVALAGASLGCCGLFADSAVAPVRLGAVATSR
jgi:hypothetical protein